MTPEQRALLVTFLAWMDNEDDLILLGDDDQGLKMQYTTADWDGLLSSFGDHLQSHPLELADAPPHQA